MGAIKGIPALLDAINTELFDYRTTIAIVIGSLTAIQNHSESPAIKELLTEDIERLEALINRRDA